MLQTLLFFHILAVVGLFVAMSLELIATARVHRAITLAEVRAATLNTPAIGPIMGLSTLLLVAMGISMIYAGGFGWRPGWIAAVFVLTVVLAILGPLVNGRKAQALYALALAAGEGPITAAVDAARRDWLFNYMLCATFFELIAALYVMVTKPDLGPSVWIIVAAAVLAAAPASLLVRRNLPEVSTEA